MNRTDEVERRNDTTCFRGSGGSLGEGDVGRGESDEVGGHQRHKVLLAGGDIEAAVSVVDLDEQ